MATNRDNSVGQQGPAQIFAPRKTGPTPPAPLEQYGHEGIRGYLLRIGRPKAGRSFTSQVMAGIKRGAME